jgi:hypothetical protein
VFPKNEILVGADVSYSRNTHPPFLFQFQRICQILWVEKTVVQVFPHYKGLKHRPCQDQAHPRLHLAQVLVWVRPTPWLYIPQTHINGCHIEQNVLGMPLLPGHYTLGTKVVDIMPHNNAFLGVTNEELIKYLWKLDKKTYHTKFDLEMFIDR